MLVGQTLRQHYKIVKYLGSGSFGVTYLAEDLDLPGHPLRVVKNLKQHYDDPEHLKRARELFDREAKVLYHLGDECSRIPRLFAHFEENGKFYLVQEFIDGHDLSKEIFPGKKWSEAEVTQLLQEILEALTFIHNKDIIHRDIKPQNLMRRRTDGKIMLIDFGAVKQINGLVGNSQGQTSVSFIVGTSGYMPSEQSHGSPKLSSDVYAVGMLGIYALTGIFPKDLPIDNDSGQVLWRNLVSVSPRLADVLDKMVRYHFKERYQTASEALQALTPPSPSTFISPSPPQSLLTSRLREVGAKQKVLIGAGAGAGVLLGVGWLFMSFLGKPTPEPEKPVADSPQATLGSPQTIPDLPPTNDVQLVCQETPISPLPSTPGRKIGTVTYYGFPNNSPLTGKGIIIFTKSKGENERYDGEIKNGKRSGCGTNTFGNGQYYIGQFKDDFFHGKGKLIFKNGCQYVGEFKNNQYDGQGTWKSKDGSYFRGLWQQGKLQGKAFSCQ